MPRTDFVKGKTVKQILDMPYYDLKKLTDSELKVLVGRLVSAGNKRLRRYQAKKGELPNAGIRRKTTQTESWQTTTQQDYEKRKFSTVGKDRTELFEEFKRAKNFMKAQTSSLMGEKSVKRESQRIIKENFGINVSDTDYDIYWKAFDRLKELHPEVDERNYKYTILAHMDKMLEQRKGKPYKSYKTFARAIEKKLQQIYEENESVKNANGTSGFFEV